uniref:MLP 34 n=1 Tax=Solanum tuberosum TaxID=4113 RepID=M1CVY8_SOLTU
MSLKGKLVSEINIKCDGDVFHEIFRHRPHHISSMCDKLQSVDIHEGEWGTVGSVISWNFIHDGKEKVAKDIVEFIDEEKKFVKFKVIGGDLLDEYKSISFSVHVESKSDQNNLVTWISEYEKKNTIVPDPHTCVNFLLNMSKDIESHHLKGMLVSEIEIKSEVDILHEIFRYRPHHISSMCPDKIQNVDIHEGEWGTVGSVISWNFTHDGKEKVVKEIVEEIDEETKLIKKKIIEGDLLEDYKSFCITAHVDTKDENNLVTWILEYEKKNANVSDPHTFMELCLNMTKDIETYHIKS